MTTAIAPVNGIEIAYETHGDPDDEPLLLVMGLGAQLIALAHRAVRGARRPRLLRRSATTTATRAVHEVRRRRGATS